MNVIISPTIEVENLISSSVAVDADSALHGALWKGLWAIGITYLEKEVVYQGIELYQSIAGGNVGQDPDITSIGESPKWVHLGKINQWRMFDGFVGASKTTATDEIITVINMDEVDYIALFDLNANDLKVEILNSLYETVWEYNFDLLEASLEIYDVYDLYFAPYPPAQRDIVIPLGWMTSTNIGDKIRVTLTGSGAVECGKCTSGRAIDLGKTKWHSEMSAINYGKPNTDTWGRTDFVSGESAKLVSGVVRIDKGKGGEGYVYRTLSSLLNKTVVWDLNNTGTEYDPLVVFGFLRDFRETIDFKNKTEFSVTIQGLI